MSWQVNRRTFLAAASATAVTQSLGLAAEAGVRAKTYTYKTVDHLEIKADVLRPDDEKIRPVVVWIHGGALIMGSRGQVHEAAKQMLAAGYVVVSIDYRLAPETKLPLILADVQDAFAWLRRRGPELFHADTGKIAVMGESAGGYLTLSTGLLVRPRPTVLVAFYGYGDIAGRWYSRPAYLDKETVSKDDAYAVVSKTPLADARQGKPGRWKFYMYCRQKGLWPIMVSGHDPDLEPKAFDRFCPVRHVTPEYPPTILIHGDKDRDVPYEQSVMMDNELAQYGVERKLITIPGGGHGFGGSDPNIIADAYQQAVAFVRKYMEE
jgi:acetyl esterase/lipase